MGRENTYVAGREEVNAFLSSIWLVLESDLAKKACRILFQDFAGRDQGHIAAMRAMVGSGTGP